MAVQTPPAFLQASSHGSELVRRMELSTLPFGSAGGIVPATPVASTGLPSDLQVTAPVSGMTVNVHPGAIWIPGTLGSGSGYGMPIGYGYPQIQTNGASQPTAKTAATQIQLTTQGVYYCYNDNSSGNVSLAIAASNPSNPRIDLIIAQVQDAQYSGGTNNWQLAVVTGTAAASPSVPALPANSLPLAALWVPAASTNVTAGNILDLRVTFNRNPFKASMYNSATQTFGAGTALMAYNTIVADPTGSCTTGASAKFVAPVSGLYAVSNGTMVTTLSQFVQANCLVNSSTVRYFSPSDVPSTTNGAAGTVFVPLNDGDTLQIQGFSGASVTVASGQANSYLDVVLLSPL